MGATTGTLTCNKMEFFKCSIAGVKYGRGVTEIERTLASRAGIQLPHEAAAASSFREPAFNFDDKCVYPMLLKAKLLKLIRSIPDNLM